jgi:DNA polymerase III alpha subunit
MELGAKYVSMTEHGNLNTAMDLYHSCKKLGAKPIMGIELYLEPPFKEELEKSYRQAFKDDKNPDKKVHDAITKYYTHLTVHFKNEAAYQHFCLLSPKMNERAIVKGGEAKPICTLDELAQASGNITICSSCFLPGTGVKTPQGIKKIEDFKGGEQIYNRYGELDTVISPTQKWFEGEMLSIRIAGTPEPIVCTPDHKFLVSHSYGAESWVEAKDLKVADKILTVNFLRNTKVDTVFKKDSYVGGGTIHKDSWYLKVCGYDKVAFLWDWIDGKVSCERRTNTLSKITAITRQDYTGYVHCLSIKNDPSFALAGGSIVHNCLIGAVQKWLLPDRVTGEIRTDLSEKSYLLLREIAGKDSFFVEIFPHRVTHNWVSPKKNKDTGLIITEGWYKPNECTPWFPDGDMQKKANQFVLDLAKKHNDPVIISLDSHFAVPEEKVIQDSRLGNNREAWRFHNSYHIYSTDDAAVTLQETLGVSDRDIEEFVDNSYKFASLFDNFSIKTSNERWVLTPLPENWQKELKRKIDYYGRMDWTNPEMIQRLKLEIDTLAHNGTINLMPYFFTVENIAEFCKREGILMNLRGSAAGSLLFYVIGASAVNPLKHDLSFGRFLTMGRIRAKDLPDADMDVSDKDRVMEYLESKYGDAFCKISIDTMLKLKSSIKDAERAIKGEVSIATENLCKKLPMFPQGANDKDLTLGYEDDSGKHPGLVDTHADLKAWILDNPDVWEAASAMLGIHRQKGVHPCGVIIADQPVQSYIPLISISGNKATGFSPKAVAMAGLVKYDVLGVNTLRDIELTIKSIKNRLGIQLDPWNLPHDERVMAAFGEGRTSSVFQFDTATVVPYLKEICPSDIDDLAVITALCRPGTLDAPSGDGRTLAQVFVARANGETIEYVHPDMEEILKDTMGIPLFQEQTIKMFRVLAGYSEEKAENARRAIGKKQKEVLDACVNDLKTSCLARGWQMNQVLLLAEQIMASANYSFNKSHAVSYAYVAYACMYLKEKYPIDWWNASLCNAAKSEIATKFWRHTKKWILLPDVNKSGANFMIEGDKIRAPLSMITGVGEKAYSQLTERGPYRDIKHFVDIFCGKQKEGERSAVHSGIVYKLIGAGVLDSLFERSDLATVEKFEIFERLKAEVKEKKQKPIKEEFIGMSDLGEYLIKKELIPIYSEDLRVIMLPHRKGFPGYHGEWLVGKAGAEYKIVDGDQITNFMTSDTANGERCCIGYVIDESIISYKNKTRQATKMQVDVGGTFFETVLWPDFNEESGAAPSGFKGLPVMMRFFNKYGKCTLKAVMPLIKKEQLEKYNVL